MATPSPGTLLLDRELLRTQFGDDDALIAELVHLFLGIYESQLAELHEALDAGDAAGTRAKAHLIRGSLGTFSPRVAALAGSVEAAAELGDLTTAEPQAAQLAADVEQLATELRTLIR